MNNTNNIVHLVVERHKLGMGYQHDCLCLNGSAHTKRTDKKAEVTCKPCLDILRLEDQGIIRQVAREIVINNP